MSNVRRKFSRWYPRTALSAPPSQSRRWHELRNRDGPNLDAIERGVETGFVLDIAGKIMSEPTDSASGPTRLAIASF